MTLLFWGITIKTLGEIIIALSIIGVHIRIMKEHKLDRKVYRSIKNEKFWAVIGIISILFGYVLELMHYNAVGLF